MRVSALNRQALTPGEAAVAAAVLLALGGLVFGSQIAHGGFWLDDWANAAVYRFASSPRYLTAARSFEDYAGGRPLLALALLAPHALFGLHTSLHHALALVLGVLTSWLFFVLLRMLGLLPLEALAVAALALVFPWADSIRLWPTASINDLAVIFYLLGTIVALRALRARGRAAVLGHAGADLLFVASVLTYEAVALVALLTGALYFTRVSARRAAAYWTADVAVLIGALLYSLVATSGARGVGTLHTALANVPQFARETASLLPLSLVPVSLTAGSKAVVLLAVAAVLVLALRAARRSDEARLRRLLLGAAAAGVALAATYVMFLSKGPSPLGPGRDNRTNVFAALPWALLVYSLVAMASLTASSFVRRLRPEATLVLVALIGAGYVVKVRHDASLWQRAADLQKPVLAALRSLPPLPRGTTIYTFGQQSEVAPEIYVFAKVYDLNGAAKIVLDDGSVHAYPIAPPVELSCTRTGVLPGGAGTHFGADESARYRRIVFLDVRSRRHARITNRNQCRQALRRITTRAARRPLR